MGLFLYVAGFGQILLALLAWAVSSSAMHEQVAATLLGFGIVSVALAAIHDQVRRP
jgi:hypothetical protein